jgi:hypothetical protein
MSEEKRSSRELTQELERLRDELAVRMHLAKAEARDQWEELEKKWEHFRARLEVVGRAAGESAEDVGDALELLGSELKRGYARIRKLL